MKDFSIRYRRRPMAGEPGFDYWVFDASRKLILMGWSRGRRSHAAEQARRDIAFHMALVNDPDLLRASS